MTSRHRILIHAACLFLFLSGHCSAMFGQENRFSGLATCSGTQEKYSCEYNGKPFANVQVSPDSPVPKASSEYSDPVFGTTIRRISPPAHGGESSLWVPIYSTKSPWSVNGTYLLLYMTNGGFFLLNGNDYSPIRRLTYQNCSGSGPWKGMCAHGNGDSSAAQWMHTKDDCFLYFSAAKLLKYCASKDQSTLIRDFGVTGAGPKFPAKSIKYLYTRDYCNFSDDDDSVALEVHAVNKSATIGFISYKISTDSIQGSLTQGTGPQYDIDITGTPGAGGSNAGHACMSPSGKYIVFQWVCGPKWGGKCPTLTQTGSRVCNNACVMDTSMNPLGARYFGSTAGGGIGAHADLGWDAQGNEVMVTGASESGSAAHRQFDSYRLSDNYHIAYPVAWSFHNGVNGGDCGPSCQNTFWISLQGTRGSLKGYAIISTDTEGGSGPDGSWGVPPQPELVYAKNAAKGALGNAEVFALFLGPETSPASHRGSGTIYRIAHNQTIHTGYWTEPHATSDYNLKKVIWGSTWRTDAGRMLQWPKDTCNSYVVDLSRTSQVEPPNSATPLPEK